MILKLINCKKILFFICIYFIVSNYYYFPSFKIFRIFGTPDETVWPEVTTLPDWNPDFPTWTPLNLQKVVPGLNEEGADLIEKLLTLDPRKRMNARDALRHPWLSRFAEDI